MQDCETHLYRHYDKAGQLLYVGISLSAIARLQQHNRAAHWSQKIDTVKIESYPTRNQAEVAEKVAIASEKPMHNIVGSPRRKSHARTIPKEFPLSYVDDGWVILETRIRDVEGDAYRVSFGPEDEMHLHSCTTYMLWDKATINRLAELSGKAQEWMDQNEALFGEWECDEKLKETFPQAHHCQVPILQKTLKSRCIQRGCDCLVWVN